MPRSLWLLWIHPPEPGLLQNEQVRELVLLAQAQVPVALHGPDKVDSAGDAQVSILFPGGEQQEEKRAAIDRSINQPTKPFQSSPPTTTLALDRAGISEPCIPSLCFDAPCQQLIHVRDLHALRFEKVHPCVLDCQDVGGRVLFEAHQNAGWGGADQGGQLG